MPFLSIFRKEKDKDASRSKTPVPISPSTSKRSSTFSRSRPSFTSSRSCVSPPPQLANISPQSDLDYVLPELDDASLMSGPSPARPIYALGGDLREIKSATSSVGPVSSVGAGASVGVSAGGASEAKQRRGLPFGRRRGSASSGLITASASASSPPATTTPRPFSEALDTFMTRKQEERDRDLDRDKARDIEPPPTPTLPHSSSNTKPEKNSTTTRQTQTRAPFEDLDSDDDPLLPPPTRASVFGGYAYSDSEKSPTRTQSLPDEEMVRSERPSRPQVNPHQLVRGKNKSADLSTLLTSSAPTSTAALPTSSSTPATSEKVKNKGKDSNSLPKTSGGIFAWRSKSSKDVNAPSPTATAAPIVPIVPPVADPAESSFSLKSFRHVGPASVPASPVLRGSASGSFSNVNLAGVNLAGVNAGVGTGASRTGSPPPSSFGRATSPTARPVPGRTGTGRERVNSAGSEGVMTAGLFRQAARRSSTNLVEDASAGMSTSPKSGVLRDRERRGPPTRAWDVGGSGSVSSGSDMPPARPPRNIRPPGGNVSDRGELGVGKPGRSVGRSSSAMPHVGGTNTRAESPTSSPESPFATALSQLGRESPFGGARSDYGGSGARSDYGAYAARSDGGRRPEVQVPSTSLSGWAARSEGGMRSVSTRPGPQPVSSNSRPGPQPASSSRLGPQPPSPTKPRQSAPTAISRSPVTRSPVRTTIPTKTNDGPSIKPRPSSPSKMSSSPTKTGRPSPTKSSPAQTSRPDAFAHSRRPSGDSSVRFASADTARAKSPPFEHRGKSASVDVLRSKPPSSDTSRSNSGFEVVRPTPVREVPRSNSSGFEVIRTKSPAPTLEARPTPRTGYKPPPRESSLVGAAGMVDSDTDESEPEADSGSEELGFGSHAKSDKLPEKERVGGTDSFGARVAANAAGPEVGALRGRGPTVFPQRNSGSGSGHDGPTTTPPRDGLSRERTITQRNAGSGRTSPVLAPGEAKPPAPPPKIGVSLFDRPTPSFDKSSSSSTSGSPFERPGASLDKFGTPARTTPRGRASHSTSALSAAATARNSAAMAEANRNLAGRSSHIRSPAVAEGTDTDEDEDDKSESDSDDNAPLSVLAPPRRPGSAASVAAPSMSRTPMRPARTQPLVNLSGAAPPPRPPRRVPGVGVTRNSSLRGSRSVEDLGRMTMAPGSVIAGRPGPRPFITSPPSSTGDSSSGKAPLTPRDGSEAGGRRVGSSLGPAGDEARRKARRRGEAKASVEVCSLLFYPLYIALVLMTMVVSLEMLSMDPALAMTMTTTVRCLRIIRKAVIPGSACSAQEWVWAGTSLGCSLRPSRWALAASLHLSLCRSEALRCPTSKCSSAARSLCRSSRPLRPQVHPKHIFRLTSRR